MELIKWFNRTRAKANVWGFGAGLLLSNFGILRTFSKSFQRLMSAWQSLMKTAQSKKKSTHFLGSSSA